jgi:capsule polysaccharide export protein KpsE/RkpR
LQANRSVADPATLSGTENPQFQAVETQIAALRTQIAKARPRKPEPPAPTSRASEISAHYLDLYRDYRFAQALYEVYARASEETEVEALATETASDAR